MKIQLRQIKTSLEKKIRFRRFRIRESMWWTRYRKQSVQRARTDVYVGEYHGRTLLNQDYFKNQHFRVMKFSLCVGNVFMKHGRAENLSIICKSGHKGSSFYYVRTLGWVGGPENGNFPLLYVVKMSLRRWVVGLKKPQNTLT